MANSRKRVRGYTAKAAERMAAGLCPWCDNPPVPSRRLCAACRDRQAVVRHRREQGRRAKGLCITCGVVPQNQTWRCAKCYQYWAAKREAWSRRRIADGYCGACGKNPLGPNLKGARGYDICIPCYLRASARRHLGSSRHWHVLLEKLEAQDYRCPYTGDKLILGVTASVDHIMPRSRFPELAHDPKNVEWITREINEFKRDRTPEELMALLHRIIEHRAGR